MVTFWRQKRTGIIYKYYGESKPYNAENYEKVSEFDYSVQDIEARINYLMKYCNRSRTDAVYQVWIECKAEAGK